MKLSDIAKKMILAMCVLFFILVVVGIAYYRSFSCLPFILGAFLGSALNILKIVMLDYIVDKAVNMDAILVSKYVNVQKLFRLLITGVILAVSALASFINLWGTVAGIFVWPIAVFFANYSTGGRKSADTNKNNETKN